MIGLKKYAPAIVALLSVFCLDRLTKQWVLSGGIPFLLNRGMCFGACSLWSCGPIISIVCAVVWISVLIGGVYVLGKRGYGVLPLALVIGGALSNLVDRILFGGVVDFIDITIPIPWYGPFSWAPFNVADVAIVAGAVWFVCMELFTNRK